MKYHLNFNDFGEYQKAFRTKVDEFNDEVYNVFKLCQNVEWVGLGYEKTISAVYNQIEELQKVSENLEKFLNFMNSASNNYSDGVKEVNSKFQEIQDIINIEKMKRGGVQ